MEQITPTQGVEKAVDAILGNRLAVLCGAGLSMAPPSSLPSAASIAKTAKQKYDATFGTTRSPLPESIDDQAQFFFEQNELVTSYLRQYVDHHAFAAYPNDGHFAIADLLITNALTIGVSTNVDILIETAGNHLSGHVSTGLTRNQVAAFPPDVSPLLKLHGCWSDKSTTIWAVGQVSEPETKQRLEDCSAWLSQQLLDRDLIVVGYWTDWDYINDLLAMSLEASNPNRIIVVDPCDSAEFEEKAPVLYELGQNRAAEFYHVQESGAVFLNQLRVNFSSSLIRRVLHAGKDAYSDSMNENVNEDWLEHPSSDANVLWHIRRDLEGCSPGVPSTKREPVIEPLLGMTILRLRAKGANADDSYWNLNGQKIRVIRTPNQILSEVQSTFEAEKLSPILAPDIVIAVGAADLSLPSSVARVGGTGSIARAAATRWFSRETAESELDI